MPASQAVSALGTQLLIGDGQSPENFNLIPECKDITGPEVTQQYNDFTHQQSTGGFREEKPGWKTSGNVTTVMQRVNNDTYQDALIAAAYAVPATLTNFKIIWPDTDQVVFAGYPSISDTAPISGDAHSLNVTIKVAGAPVRT